MSDHHHQTETAMTRKLSALTATQVRLLGVLAAALLGTAIGLLARVV